MKFSLSLEDGTWIGGFMARRDNIHEVLEELREQADGWKQPLIATRVDNVKRGQRLIIQPTGEKK